MPTATLLVAVSKLLLTKWRTSAVLNLLAGSRTRRGKGLDPDLAAQSVAAASGWLRANCLPQAIALAALLQRNGKSPAVVIGCRLYGPGRWGAHAWVEADGKRFDTLDEHAEHTELARLTASSRWQPRPGNTK